MYGSKKVIGKMPDMKTFANWERVGGNNAIVEHVQGLLLYHHLHWPLETPPPPPPSHRNSLVLEHYLDLLMPAPETATEPARRQLPCDGGSKSVGNDMCYVGKKGRKL